MQKLDTLVVCNLDEFKQVIGGESKFSETKEAILKDLNRLLDDKVLDNSFYVVEDIGDDVYLHIFNPKVIFHTSNKLVEEYGFIVGDWIHLEEDKSTVKFVNYGLFKDNDDNVGVIAFDDAGSSYLSHKNHRNEYTTFKKVEHSV